MRRRVVHCVAAVGLVAALGCASPEERFAEHLQRADAHLAKGRIDDALLEMQGALKIHPEDADLNERLGRLLAARGNTQPAVFHLGEAYRLDPERIEAGVLQAQLVWKTAPPRAEQILRDVIARHPEDPRVHRGESALAVAMGDQERALAAAERARDLAPEDPENWVTLGAAHVAHIRALQSKKQNAPDALYLAALAAFDKVDELVHGHVGARVEKARVHASWPGHREQAAAAFRDAIALAKQAGDPGPITYAARSMAEYAQMGRRPALQQEALREVVKVDASRVREWDRLARVTAQLEGPDAAEAVYQELLAAQPDLPAAHVTYANYLSQQQRSLDAIAHLDRTISDGLDEPVLWEQLFRLELTERRLPDARATLAEMEDRHEDDPHTIRAGARLALAEERYAEAIEILQPLQGARESAEAERLRAIAHMNLKNYAAANSAVQRALKMAPGDPAPSLRLKVAVHDAAGEWEDALRTLSRLDNHGGLTPAEELTRARAFYGVGKPEEGRKALQTLLAGAMPPPEAAVEYARREGASDPQGARTHLARAIARAPGHFEALEAATLLDIRAGDVQGALARLDKLVQSQLAGPRVLLLRAEALAAAGQLDRAEADALRAFEAAPQLARAVDLLYAIYVAQGKVAEARRSFEEAESVGVLHDGARVLLGRLYMVEGMADKAQETYEKILAKDSNVALAKNDLAFLLASRNEDLPRATTLAEEAQRALPDHPAVADTVGFVYLQSNRQDAALQQFRYALELARAQAGPESPIVHYHLGLSLLSLGRKQDAAGAFQKALEINPSFPGSDDARRLLEEARHATDAPPSAS
jgi:tetratricopeptide (TPR) repeat protein